MNQVNSGDGKTTLTLMLISMLSNRKNTYNVYGLKINKLYNVIFLTAEDVVDDTSKHKLDMMRVNCERVVYLEGEKSLDLEGDSIEKLIIQLEA